MNRNVEISRAFGTNMHVMIDLIQAFSIYIFQAHH